VHDAQKVLTFYIMEQSNIFILFRVNSTNYSGQNILSLLGQLPDLEPKLCHLELLEKMILVK
jgi:hypothetical protein